MSQPTTDPVIVVVSLGVCDWCLASVGKECHTPGCAFWMHDVPAADTAAVLYEHRTVGTAS